MLLEQDQDTAAVWKGAVEFPEMQPGVKCQFTGVLCVYSGHFHTASITQPASLLQLLWSGQKSQEGENSARIL